MAQTDTQTTTPITNPENANAAKPNKGFWGKWFGSSSQKPDVPPRPTAASSTTPNASSSTNTPATATTKPNTVKANKKPQSHNTVPGIKKKKLTRQQARARIELIRKYAKLLDAIPGLPIKIGLDGIIGLIPGVGDLSTGALALALIYLARDLDIPTSLQTKMLWNVLIDVGVGTVPLFGDIFDVMFKANLKNLKLLEKWFEKNISQFEETSEA